MFNIYAVLDLVMFQVYVSHDHTLENKIKKLDSLERGTERFLESEEKLET